MDLKILLDKDKFFASQYEKKEGGRRRTLVNWGLCRSHCDTKLTTTWAFWYTSCSKFSDFRNLETYLGQHFWSRMVKQPAQYANSAIICRQQLGPLPQIEPNMDLLLKCKHPRRQCRCWILWQKLLMPCRTPRLPRLLKPIVIQGHAYCIQLVHATCFSSTSNFLARLYTCMPKGGECRRIRLTTFLSIFSCSL